MLAAVGVVAAVAVIGTATAHAGGPPEPTQMPTVPMDPSKSAQWQNEERTRAWQQAHPRPKPGQAEGRAEAKAAEATAPVRTAGIGDTMHQGPFAAMDFTVANFYQGPTNVTWVLIYAGAVRDPITGAIDKGALRVYAEPEIGGPITAIGTFAPAPTVGIMHIVDVRDGRLILATTDGPLFAFDLGTPQFDAL